MLHFRFNRWHENNDSDFIDRIPRLCFAAEGVRLYISLAFESPFYAFRVSHCPAVAIYKALGCVAIVFGPRIHVEQSENMS